MRKEYDRNGTTDTAVIEGLGRTGRLVTSAAVILFLAFAAMAAAPTTDLKILATALGAGILLDATIIRALLLPAPGGDVGLLELVVPAPAGAPTPRPDARAGHRSCQPPRRRAGGGDRPPVRRTQQDVVEGRRTERRMCTCEH
jgi:hypothetical protein